MAIDQGMNVGEVKALAEQLKAAAGKFDAIVQMLNSKVGTTTWVGPDATKFKNDWWPAHRSRLQQLRTDLEGFGQSAHNNATAQEGASDGGDGGGTVTPAPGTIDPRDLPTTMPVPVPDAVSPRGSIGALTGSEDELRRGFLDDWRKMPSGYDQWNFGYDSDGDAKFGNCTSYVAWRMNNLAEQQGLGADYFSNNNLGSEDNLRFGNAYEWAKQSSALGHPPDQAPSAGAVAWWDNNSPLGSYGHVAVVRSVNADGSVTIEQSGWDSYDFKVETIQPGDKRFPTGFLHLLPNT